MKNYVLLFCILIAVACSDNDNEPLHPFKFEANISQESLSWKAPDFNYNYSLGLDAAHREDSINYGFILFRGLDRVSVYTRKVATAELDSFFEPR